jgi:hypothetical protein
MVTFVQTLNTDGYLTTTNGSFHKLDDFDEEWAQINWYHYWMTGYDPSDFILRAHMAWSTDTTTPNPSGCGIVFRMQDDQEGLYVVTVTTAGYVKYGILRDNYIRASGGLGYFGQPAVSGEADFAMVAVRDRFDIFINGERIRTYYGKTNDWLEGDLAYTILSGTNAGYGTRCEMTNIALWEIEP